MAMFGIGKKKPAKAPPPPSDAATEQGAEEGVEAPAPAGKVKAAKPAAPKKAARKFAADLDIYTAVLAAAFIALAAGCVLIAMDNLAGVEGSADEGNPFAVVSSH